MADSSIYRRRARLPFRQLAGQTVILNPKERNVHLLNGTGSLIWELLEAQRSAEDLVDLLNGEDSFDADREQMAREVRAFLEELSSKGLVEAQPGPGDESKTG